MIDIKNYVLTKLATYDDGSGDKLDTRPGSVLHDFLVAPLADVLAPFAAEQERLLSEQAILDPANMTEEAVDAIGTKYLLTRNLGQKASGVLYVYYNSPRSLTITKGTVFQSIPDNLEFEVTKDYLITRAQMEYNTSYLPYYVAGPIQVSAASEGNEFNLESLTLFRSNTKLLSNPIKITNLQKFTTGELREDNVTFYERIKRSIFGNSLASNYAIDGFIKDNYPEIVETSVIGANSPLMIRDLSYTITAIEQAYIDNFMYVYSGLHNTALNFKGHIAYVNAFSDFNATSGINLPNLADFTDEFSNNDYAGVSKKIDTKYTEHSNITVFSDFNYTPPTDSVLQFLAISGNWVLGDGANDNGALYTPDEFGFSGSKLRLGKTVEQASTTIPKIYLNTSSLNALKEKIDAGETANASALLTELTDVANTQNFSPVLHRKLSQTLGIDIQVEMSTSDSTENGEVAYITTMRREGIISPHDGFGLAWRKQPEFLLRLDANDYGSDLEQQAADEAKFLEYFQVSFSDVVGQLSDVSNKQYWFYNYFIVDNDVLQDDIWIGSDQILDQSLGRNQFLVAAKTWIKPDTTYTFKLVITEGLAVQGYLDGVQVVNLGTRYPAYKLAQDYNIIASDVDNRSLRGQFFGFGVAHTKNSEWYVSNLEITRNVEAFPMHLFKFDVNEFPEFVSNGCNVEYYGVGYDASRSVNPLYSGLANSKINLYAYNYDNSDWDLIGTNTEAFPSNGVIDLNDVPNYVISGQIPVGGVGSPSSYTDGQGFVSLMATPYNTGPSFPGNTDHTLRSFYIELNNGASVGVHRGNCVDVYVNDPKNIEETITNLGIISSATVSLKNIPGLTRYIQDIVEVYVSDNLTGAVLSTFDSTEYSIINNNTGTTFGGDSDYQIIFNDSGIGGTNISIKYRYWANGAAVDTLLNTSEYRFPTVSYSAKVMPPAVVSITALTYSGSPTVDEVKTVIKNYINNTLNLITLDKYAFINLLTGIGVTYIDLNNISFTVKEYDTVFKATLNTINTTTQSFTLQNSLSRFFCMTSDLNGIVKI